MVDVDVIKERDSSTVIDSNLVFTPKIDQKVNVINSTESHLSVRKKTDGILGLEIDLGPKKRNKHDIENDLTKESNMIIGRENSIDIDEKIRTKERFNEKKISPIRKPNDKLKKEAEIDDKNKTKIEANYDCKKINLVTEKISEKEVEKIEAQGTIEKKKENWLETIKKKLEGQETMRTPIGKKILSIQGKENSSSSPRRKLGKKMRNIKNEQKIRENCDIRKMFWKMRDKIGEELNDDEIYKKIDKKINKNSDNQDDEKIPTSIKNMKKISPLKRKNVKDLVRKFESKSDY